MFRGRVLTAGCFAGVSSETPLITASRLLCTTANHRPAFEDSLLAAASVREAGSYQERRLDYQGE